MQRVSVPFFYCSVSIKDAVVRASFAPSHLDMELEGGEKHSIALCI